MKIKMLTNVKVMIEGQKTVLADKTSYDLDEGTAKYLIENKFAEEAKAKKESKKKEESEE